MNSSDVDLRNEVVACMVFSYVVGIVDNDMMNWMIFNQFGLIAVG